MNNLIPDEYKAWSGLIISLVVAVLAVAMEWQDLGPVFTQWTGRVFALLVVLSNVLGLKVSNPKGPGR